MDIGSIIFDRNVTNSVGSTKNVREVTGTSFFDHLMAAQENAGKSLPGNMRQQSSKACISQTIQASQMAPKASEPQPQADKEQRMFFPPGFPEDMKRQLTDFINNSNLSSAEKDAMWATTVVSLHLMNYGPPGFRRYLTEESRFGSPRFNSVNLIAQYGNALAARGYPNIGKAVQDFLQNADRSAAASFA